MGMFIVQELFLRSLKKSMDINYKIILTKIILANRLMEKTEKIQKKYYKKDKIS